MTGNNKTKEVQMRLKHILFSQQQAILKEHSRGLNIDFSWQFLSQQTDFRGFGWALLGHDARSVLYCCNLGYPLTSGPVPFWPKDGRPEAEKFLWSLPPALSRDARNFFFSLFSSVAFCPLRVVGFESLSVVLWKRLTQWPDNVCPSLRLHHHRAAARCQAAFPVT